VGSLQRSCPLQSNQICQAIQPTFERQLLIDHQILNLCLPLTQFNENLPPIILSHEDIAFGISKILPPPKPSDSIHPRNIFELFEFTEDLKVAMSFEKPCSGAVSSSREEPEPVSGDIILPPKKNSSESKETSTQSKESKSNLDSSSKSSKQKNPFKSAKEQFSEEVGPS
jgi:hypothetical protein